MSKKQGQKPKVEKPSLAEVLAREDIPRGDRERIEAAAVRLIQIQSEIKALEEERGYSKDGVRVRGLADELEELFVKWDIPGVRAEDYLVFATAGSRRWVDGGLLLAQGVLPEQIKAATVESNWTGVQVRRDREGGGEFE